MKGSEIRDDDLSITETEKGGNRELDAFKEGHGYVHTWITKSGAAAQVR